MKNLLFIFVLSITTNYSWAESLPHSKEEFCKRFDDLDIMSDYSSEPNNLMSFKNQGGVFNGGVCWWHSRFQRNVFYLSLFRPDLPKLDPKNVKALIKEIRAGKSVVTIPGFYNFNEFSNLYKKEILKELEDWQIYDGVILGAWIDGLKGETKTSASILLQKMDEIYEYVEIDKKIAYLKLQMKGITAHAWLIVGIKRGPNGFDVGLIDSNNPMRTENYTYKIGDESFYDKSYGNFVPYLEFIREETRLQTVAQVYCGLTSAFALSESKFNDDYKQDLKDFVSSKNR